MIKGVHCFFILSFFISWAHGQTSLIPLDSIPEDKKEVILLILQGTQEQDQGHFITAQNYFLDAIETAKAKNDDHAVSISFSLLSSLYLKLNQSHEALSYLDSSLAYCNNKTCRSDYYLDKLGVINQLSTYSNETKKSLIREVIQQSSHRNNASYTLALSYYYLNQNDSSSFYLQKAFDENLTYEDSVKTFLLFVQLHPRSTPDSILNFFANMEVNPHLVQDKINALEWLQINNLLNESLVKRQLHELRKLEKRQLHELLYSSLLEAKKVREVVQSETALRANLIALSERNQILVIVGIIFSILSVFILILLVKTKKQAKALDKSSKENRLLLKEANHRISNNLQVIQAIISLSKSQKESDPSQLLEDIENRIRTIASTHQYISQPELLDNENFKLLIRDLFSAAQNQYAKSVNLNLSLSADVQRFHPVFFSSLMILINEWITNSFKHAFTDNIDHSISLKIEQNGNSFNISFQDSGNVESTGKSSIGTQLINAIITKHQGKRILSVNRPYDYEVIFPTDKVTRE